MDIVALFQAFLYQLVTARDQPVPVVLASIVTAVIVWLVMRWRSASVIHNLKRGIARRDSELNKLRAHIPMGEEGDADAPLTPSVVRPGGRQTSDQQKALRLVVNATDQAELALTSSDPREADRAAASMALALQTVGRVFGLPVPGMAASAAENLAMGRDYLATVKPALRAGRTEDARRAAVSFLANAEVARLDDRDQPGRIAS